MAVPGAWGTQPYRTTSTTARRTLPAAYAPQPAQQPAMPAPIPSTSTAPGASAPQTPYYQQRNTGFVPQSVQQQAQGVSTVNPNMMPASSVAPPAASSPMGSAPGPYPASSGFEDRDPFARRAAPGASPDYIIDRLRQVSGPFADIIAPEGGQPILRKDIPLLEAGLNYENLLKAERDRQFGYEQLTRGREAIGSSPGEMLAMEIAMQRAQGGTPWNDQFIQGQVGALKDRSAIARRNAMEGMEQSFAARGISGVDPALAQANLEQDLLGQLSGQIGDIYSTAATQRDQAERAALEQLTGITQEQGQRRTTIDQALADLFLNTERAPIDLSGLIEPVPAKIGKAPLTESGSLETKKTRTADLPKDLAQLGQQYGTSKPDYLSQKEWNNYIWRTLKPKGTSTKDYHAQLQALGLEGPPAPPIKWP